MARLKIRSLDNFLDYLPPQVSVQIKLFSMHVDEDGTQS